jgi:hypothetical protein
MSFTRVPFDSIGMCSVVVHEDQPNAAVCRYKGGSPSNQIRFWHLWLFFAHFTPYAYFLDH